MREKYLYDAKGKWAILEQCLWTDHSGQEQDAEHISRWALRVIMFINLNWALKIRFPLPSVGVIHRQVHSAKWLL
jgi:hypothetical protein